MSYCICIKIIQPKQSQSHIMKTKQKPNSKLDSVKKLQNSRDKIVQKLDNFIVIALQFEQEFKRENFEHKVVTLTADDLPLIDYMRSEKINNNNRSKDTDNVKRLFRCLKGGAWHYESDDIKICPDGYLLNGQHTLEAISQYFNDATTEEGAEVLLGFKLGVSVGAMPYFDTQKKRSPEQNLKIKGVALNPIQKQIVLAEGRYSILGNPFPQRGQINYFEYEDVIKVNQGVLDRVFDAVSLSTDFPYKAIGYALFLLAKNNEELAQEIMDDIKAQHSEALKDGSTKSRYKVNLGQEHSLVELFREEKHLKMSHMTSKTSRDCYRQEEFFPIAVNWLLENYKIDRKVFSL